MTDLIRLLVVDDHSLFREGVIHSFDKTPDIEVVGEASDGAQALDKARELLPDIVLLDVTMRPMGGLETLKHLSSELPVCKVIMLTVAENEDTLLKALKDGASGYVLKGINADELVRVVRAVYRGEVYITPTMAASLLVDMATGTGQTEQHPIHQLSERERAILELVAQGHTNRQIGSELHLAEKTVKHYMTNILQKLQVNNRVQAALIASQQGLLKE